MQTKVKFKKCECGKEFKQYNSLSKYCSWECKNKNTTTRILPKKPIPKVSKKQKELNKIYQSLKIDFFLLPENQICPVTKEPATEVHHKHCGSNRQKYFLDTPTWLGVSRKGHDWIHNHPKQAREKGWLY